MLVGKVLNLLIISLQSKLDKSFYLGTILCLSGQEMAPTGKWPLLKYSWRQNSIFWEEQLADP